MSEQKVVVSITKKFGYRSKKFECLELNGPAGVVWFAKSVNLSEAVVLSQPTWEKLKAAMKERVDAEANHN